MSSKPDLHLEVAHVLFMDVVGFSKLLINDQSEILDQLNEIVRQTRRFCESEAAGKLVRLPTGDGMALVFFDSGEAPVQCALETSEALKSYPEIKLRMGVHSGPVNAVTDVNDRSNVTGAGINMAQRVMDCGDAGHVLLSRRVADDLEQYRQWQPCLHDLGECEVKHGIRVHVVNLYNEKWGNPEVPEKFKQQAKGNKTRAAGEASVGRTAAIRWAAITAVMLMLAAIGFWLSRARSSTKVTHTPVILSSESIASPGPADLGKSIAVLPFENLSRDPDNGFFTDGVQDEILTDLAKIADLKVISRTSVMEYKTGVARNLREIGKALRVSYLLEGSVQRASNRVRVNAQLIDAQTDAHLWARTYDRDLADVFAIQSEIAETIADQLRAKLSPAEKAEIDQKPTADVAAFDLYTRGKALLDGASNSDTTREDLLHGIEFLTQAIGRDPAFLVAYCQLANAHDLLYLLGYDHTPGRLAQGQSAVDAAVRLVPDSGETHLAVASHLYAKLEYDRAREELGAAHRTLPNSARTFALSGFINRRQGRWPESTRDLEHALELDPNNVLILEQLGNTYAALSAYPEEAAALERVISLRPDDFNARISRAQLEVFWRADTRPLHALVEARLEEHSAAAQKLAQTRLFLALCERDLSGIENALVALGDNTFGPDSVQFSRAFEEGVLARMKGDTSAAHAAFAVDRVAQERKVQAQPDYGPAVSILGMIDAGLGRKEDALREGQRGVQLLPVSKDAINGPRMITNLAVIAAWIGEKDLSLQQLHTATQLANGPPYGILKLYPLWDPLRGDPRFDQIVASLAPKDSGAMR